MTQQYDVYAIGNALVDTEIEVSDAFLETMDIGKGMMTLVDKERQMALLDALREQADPHSQTCGGSAANTIIATRYFGGSTFYTCRVANDDTGELFVQALTAAGVDTNMTGARPEGVSGTCLVMVTRDAERTMNTFLGISETVSSDDIDEAALRASRYAYIEGYLVTSPSGRAATIRLRELARQHGVQVAMTFSDPAMVRFFRDGLLEMIGDGVDLLFCNEDEARDFTDTDSADAALAALKTYSHKVVMTRGADGALAWDGETLHTIAGVPVTAVDTNGAGDMFAGAFLYGITQGHDFATAGRLASHAAAQVVSDFGPRLTPEAHLAVRRQVLGQ
ncbi:adenosine kinase [Alcanivorax sp. JB21]|uniref:adenosine kinase n=1 Tax=Alcanivorax limicola TaxID=2874102 RepID=UPI001CBDCDD7|nr:adenosine kinase [Alcanivorax limicola]MBZ2189443.1 adenosine kinase [Alcanivorax limicola]